MEKNKTGRRGKQMPATSQQLTLKTRTLRTTII